MKQTVLVAAFVASVLSFTVGCCKGGEEEEESERKKGESLLSSTPVVVLSAILGRTPNVDEYKTAVEGIPLTQFAPPVGELVAN